MIKIAPRELWAVLKCSEARQETITKGDTDRFTAQANKVTWTREKKEKKNRSDVPLWLSPIFIPSATFRSKKIGCIRDHETQTHSGIYTSQCGCLSSPSECCPLYTADRELEGLFIDPAMLWMTVHCTYGMLYPICAVNYHYIRKISDTINTEWFEKLMDTYK